MLATLNSENQKPQFSRKERAKNGAPFSPWDLFGVSIHFYVH